MQKIQGSTLLTYGLIDSGSSGSLINSDIVQKGNFNVQSHKKPIKWDTASGTLLTQGAVEIKKCCLPQFTTNRHIASTFHTFYKRPNDKYNVILGRDLLWSIGLTSTTVHPNSHGITYLKQWYLVGIGQKKKLNSQQKLGTANQLKKCT
jgi:hypothetical protein